MLPTIVPVSGLPRSGSTLLVNLLAQNPAFHVTPTNDLITLVNGVRNQWHRLPGFMAQGLKSVQPRVASALRGLTYGFYEKELSQGKVVFDKNRGWLGNIELLEEVYGREVRVICTIRDVRSVLGSFEKLYRANPLARNQYVGQNYLKSQTAHGRAQILLGDGGVVGASVNMIRDALGRGVSDRLILVPYQTLTHEPQATLNRIHDRLNVPRFAYNPDRVVQVTHEEDAIHGWGHDLHTIRPRVEPARERPWEGILPPRTARWVDAEYADINQIAGISRSR